jgi:hypothetical protein
MLVDSCIPVIPTSGCISGSTNEQVLRPTPENYEGIRLYWAPDDLKSLRERLLRLGYSPSEIVDRDYGQTEFFVTDDDGYSHRFGVATNKSG